MKNIFSNIKLSEYFCSTNLNKIFNNLLPYILLIVGLFIFCSPMLANPDCMPGDLGDERFINYVLEHGFQWLKQSELHTSFWDMPIFYPFENTLAFSDILLGGMLLYIPVRIFTGASIYAPQTALQICFVLVCILNYLSCFMLMRKTFKFEKWLSSIGAYLFSFGLLRHIQIGHFQLMLQFFMIFSILAFSKINIKNSKLKNNLLFFTGNVMFVLQIYTSFYLGWFMVFGLGIALIVCLIFKDSREKIFSIIKLWEKEICFWAFFTLILLIPLIYHYLAVQSQFEWVNIYLLNQESFLSSESFLDIFIWFPYQEYSETMIGAGYFTTFFILIGLLKSNSETNTKNKYCYSLQ